MPTLTETTADVLGRMLRRLPSSLWDTDPTSPTLQRDLYQAISAQLAVWLENRDIARKMTLLREASGVDLDALMADYGLKRYLQRPDAYARQIAQNILFYPRCTEYSIRQMADLLFDAPHVTMRTGRSETHVFLSLTHPITTPYEYWQLISDDGLVYAVTVDAEVPVLSTIPPAGLNVTPSEHSVRWFAVLDELGATWYVSAHGDTLTVSQTQPAGYGTTAPFSVLDGQGQRWRMTVHSRDQALVTTLDTGLTAVGYWQLRSREGVVHRLYIEGSVPTFAPTSPGGTVDQTPGGAPLDYLTVPDEHGVSWYVSIEHDTLMTTSTPPGGTTTAVPFAVLDANNQLWSLTVHSGEGAVVANALDPINADNVVLTPGGTATPYQTFQLIDSAAVPWWVSLHGETVQTTSTAPAGAQDVTPAGGPFSWLRAFDLRGQRYYVFPTTTGILRVETTNPGGTGTQAPQTLGDEFGVVWHYGIDPAGNLATSDVPNVDYGGMATAICLNDPNGDRWFWRVNQGTLEWSRQLWPDTMDQSPWGEIGWLQMTNEVGDVYYVYPTVQGYPTASVGPPVTSPWGWKEPVRLWDAQGQPWRLTLRSRTPQLEYWQMRQPDGSLVALYIAAEVPATLAVFVGTDRTPGGEPLDWFTVYDEYGQRWYVRIIGDTLRATLEQPQDHGTLRPLEIFDGLGRFWRLTMNVLTEALVTEQLASSQVVDVAPEAGVDIPNVGTPLAIRDAVEAFGHIQPAGGLVTVKIA